MIYFTCSTLGVFSSLISRCLNIYQHRENQSLLKVSLLLIVFHLEKNPRTQNNPLGPEAENHICVPWNWWKLLPEWYILRISLDPLIGAADQFEYSFAKYYS